MTCVAIDTLAGSPAWKADVQPDGSILIRIDRQVLGDFLPSAVAALLPDRSKRADWTVEPAGSDADECFLWRLSKDAS